VFDGLARNTNPRQIRVKCLTGIKDKKKCLVFACGCVCHGLQIRAKPIANRPKPIANRDKPIANPRQTGDKPAPNF